MRARSFVVQRLMFLRYRTRRCSAHKSCCLRKTDQKEQTQGKKRRYQTEVQTNVIVCLIANAWCVIFAVYNRQKLENKALAAEKKQYFWFQIMTYRVLIILVWYRKKAQAKTVAAKKTQLRWMRPICVCIFKMSAFVVIYEIQTAKWAPQSKCRNQTLHSYRLLAYLMMTVTIPGTIPIKSPQMSQPKRLNWGECGRFVFVFLKWVHLV